MLHPQTASDSAVHELDRTSRMCWPEPELYAFNLPPDLFTKSRPGHRVRCVRKLGVGDVIVEHLAILLA